MALTFNGSNYLSKATALVAAAPMTFACWYKPSAVAADAQIMGITSATSTHHSIFSMVMQTADKKVRCGISNDAGSTTDFTGVASTVLSAGTLYHLCCVFTSTTSRTAYVNGGNSSTSVVSVSPGTCDSTYIGAIKANAAVVAGAIGDIAYPGIWNVALTATDVATLASAFGPIRIRPSALVACPRISGGTNPETDLVSSTTWTIVGG